MIERSLNIERELLSSKIGRKFMSPREIPYPVRPLVSVGLKDPSCLLAIRDMSPHSAIGVTKI